MSKLKRKLLSVLYPIKQRISMSKLWVGKKLGFIRSVMIMPYRGFGNRKELFFLGRVLGDRQIGLSQPEDSRWRNFKKMYKRFMTWKIPGAKLEASFNDITKSVTTDEKGYFEFRIDLPQPLSGHNPWQKIRVELVDKVVKNQNPPVVFNDLFVPSENVEFGVISDIADTIVPTGATRMWEMLKTTFPGKCTNTYTISGSSCILSGPLQRPCGAREQPFLLRLEFSVEFVRFSAGTVDCS